MSPLSKATFERKAKVVNKSQNSYNKRFKWDEIISHLKHLQSAYTITEVIEIITANPHLLIRGLKDEIRYQQIKQKFDRLITAGKVQKRLYKGKVHYMVIKT